MKRLKNINFKRHIRDVNNFEFNPDNLSNIGEFPVIIKIILSVVLAVLILFLSNQFYFKDLKTEYKTLVNNEKTLKDEVILKINLTAGKEKYEEKIKDMNKSFETLLSQLPTDIEMDGLLSDITKKGIDNGIEFKKLQMLKDIKTEYYIEHPIEIVMDGTYHSLSKFIGDISNLNRIVTFHDFELTNSTTDKGLLTLKVIAKTYKYRDKSKEVKDVAK